MDQKTTEVSIFHVYHVTSRKSGIVPWNNTDQMIKLS